MQNLRIKDKIINYFKDKTVIKSIIGILIYVIWFYGAMELLVRLFVKVASEDFIMKYEHPIDITIQFIAYIPILIGLLLVLKKDIKEDFFEARKDTSKLANNIIFGILMMYGVNIVAVILSQIFNASESVNQSEIEEMVKSSTFAPFILFFLLGIIGPFVEEVVYHKCLSNLIKNKYAFIVVSMFVFGFIHVLSTDGSFLYRLKTAIPYISQGFTFSFLYIKNNKNLTVPIACHMFNNILALLFIVI